MWLFRLLLVIDLICLAYLYKVACYPKWKQNKYMCFLKTMLYVYFIGVMVVTNLLPIVIPIPGISMSMDFQVNLIPFIDVLMGRGEYIKQIILNIVMLIPFGVLYPLIYKKTMKQTLYKTLIISVSIELIQMMIPKTNSCDVTDIITNFLGGCVGYMLFRLFYPYGLSFLQSKFSKIDKIRITYTKSQKIIFTLMCIQWCLRSVMIYFI